VPASIRPRTTSCTVHTRSLAFPFQHRFIAALQSHDSQRVSLGSSCLVMWIGCHEHPGPVRRPASKSRLFSGCRESCARLTSKNKDSLEKGWITRCPESCLPTGASRSCVDPRRELHPFPPRPLPALCCREHHHERASKQEPLPLLEGRLRRQRRTCYLFSHCSAAFQYIHAD
jgi:hypothetical protein